MKKHLLLATALCLGIATLQARPVDLAKAQQLGQQFVQHKPMFNRNAAENLNLAYTLRAANGMPTGYVFNFDGGFVIVAADDCSSPILGYSDCGQFDYENAPDGFRFMLNELSRGIENAVNNGVKASSEIICRWKNLEAYGVLNPERNTPVVGPLVQQRWNQDNPYNLYVPSGCPTGCVATAMAQLMKYWEWPVTGTGEHSYYSQGYGQQYANFGATTYQWDNMIDYYGNATQEQKEAVATLMYHCGVSVDMQYAPAGSGAFSQDVPVSISTYFSYSDHATHIQKGGDYDEWIALLKSNIDQRIPLYYSGQSSEGGHAFICDGYDADDLFHFNWGWGGALNNYFLIDGENFEYSGSQAIIYDFVPNYVYNTMPQTVENLTVSIDSDVSLTGHLTWTNPVFTEAGETLASIDKVVVKRNGVIVHEIYNMEPGQTVTYDDVVPFFDQYEYTIMAVSGDVYGRSSGIKAVFGPYCEWSVIMTSASFHGWDGGGITVQNAAGSYIDFLTTNTASASMQRFQMALGNNNLYWVEPTSSINNISFKVRDAENQVVYEYSGPSSGLESGLIRTLNNSCGNENTCEAPYNLRATIDPGNDRTIVLDWDSDHTPEFGYCIYRDGFLFNMSHETHYVDEETEIGGHCYYITALCNGGETANSNEYCITSGSDCDAPSGLYYNFYNGNKVELHWSASENENVTGYYVYRKTEGTDFKLIKPVLTTSYRDNTANPEITYWYAVKAYYDNNDCHSAYADALLDDTDFYVEVDWAQRPRSLQASVNENLTEVSLRWKPAYQATSYDIMCNGEKLFETVEPFFVHAGVSIGETYCYQVIAHGEGFDEASNEVCVEMPSGPALPCPAPTNFRYLYNHAPADDDMIRLTWSHPVEERWPDHFVITVIDHLAGDTTDVVVTLEDFRYQEAIDFNGMDRSYKVKAVYDDCESEYGLTADGEDFIRFSNMSVGEHTNSVRLYPNPASSQLTVEAAGMTKVSIYNLVGQCLMEGKAKDGTASLDLNGLQNGIYLVKVSTQKGSVIEKVVKM